MIHLRPADIRKMPAGKISSTVLYALVALVAVAFILFYSVGYGMPYDDDPQFNAPLFTDVLLSVIYIVLGMTLVALFFSAVLSLRPRSRDKSFSNGIPSAAISYAVSAFVFVCLVVTFAFGSTAPLRVGGEEYSDSFWLMAADMFVNTVTILIVAVVLLIVLGTSGYVNRIKLKKGNVQKKQA